jgi:hypothetical protein
VRGLEGEVGREPLPHARTPGGADEADDDAVVRIEDGDDALQQLRREKARDVSARRKKV